MAAGLDANVLDLMQRLGVALAIGFLTGVERGWREREVREGGRTAGIRTYALFGLLGGVTGLLALRFGALAFAGIALPFAVIFAAFKWREESGEQDFSVTSVIAGLIVFGLGAYAVAGEMQVAAAAGVGMVLLLAMRGELHAWLNALTWPEIRGAILLLAMSVIALPLLPNRGLGPHEAINPFALWAMTITLAGLSFLAYVAVRVLGPKRGPVIAIVLGALVSSTAVTLDAGRRAKDEPNAVPFLAGAALLASVVMAARMGAIAATLSLPLAQALAAPLLVFAAVSLAIGGLLLWRSAPDTGKQEDKLQSPLDLRAVFKFAALLAIIIVASTIIQRLYGEAGLLPMAAVAGLADVDAMTLSASRLVGHGTAAEVGAHAVLIAAVANTLSKTVLATLAGSKRFGLFYGGASAAALAAGALALFI